MIKIFVTVLTSCLLAVASAGAAATSILRGQVLGLDGKPFQGAEVQIQPVGIGARGMILHTGADGRYAQVLPAGTYRFALHYSTVKIFAADKIQTRAGDPFTIDYNVRTGMVKMRTAKSKKVRRFVWQEPLGSDLGGYWRETDSDTALEADSNRGVRQAPRGVSPVLYHSH